MGKVNVIVENYDGTEGRRQDDEDDDEETVVQIQEALGEEAEPQQQGPEAMRDIESMANRGQLVDQILEQMMAGGAEEREGGAAGVLQRTTNIERGDGKWSGVGIFFVGGCRSGSCRRRKRAVIEKLGYRSC